MTTARRRSCICLRRRAGGKAQTCTRVRYRNSPMDGEKFDMRKVRRDLGRHMKSQRRHAAHFDWFDKPIKEAGIVESFLDPKNHKGKHSYSRFKMESKDPPDAWLFDSNNSKIALEITELVNEDAITAQIKHECTGGLTTARDYGDKSERWSDRTYLKGRVTNTVLQKDQKCDELFAGGQTVELLLHSDEPYLIDNLEKIATPDFRVGSRFRRVWLLLSYDPRTESYPLVELA